MKSRQINLFSALATAVFLTACGGGGGGSAPVATTSTPTTPVVTPAVTPVVAPVVAAGYTLANPPTSSYTAGSAQRAMFNSLNQVRLGGGFGALEQDLRLDQAASAHADYVITNYFPGGIGVPSFSTIQPDGWITAHTETAGTTGFTGSRPVNRIIAAGYSPINSGENLDVIVGKNVGEEPDMTVCMSNLLNTVFHRAALLDTTYLNIGFGISKPTIAPNGFILRACVLDFGAKEIAPVLAQSWVGFYPFDGQTGVPVTMKSEVPDPLPSAPIKGGPIGIQTASLQNLTVNNFTLRDASGQVVNAKVVTRADTTYMRTNEAYLVPIGSLIVNSTYFVTFTGTSNGTIVNKNWSFKT